MACVSNPTVWSNPRLKGRLPELDGVRGLAILSVLIWHYLMRTIHVGLGTWKAHLLAPFRITWSGVDLFFVLSGFLIGGILYDAKDSDSYFKTFYLRRIHRIFPIYFIWIALFILGLYVVGPNSLISPLRVLFNRDIPTWSYPLFLQNFFMSAHAGFGAQWMGITWSLSVEEQFYLLLPLLMRQFSYRGIAKLALAAIVAAPLVRLILLWSGNSFGPYTLLPCRTDALGFGVLVAIACRNKSAWTWLESHRAHLYWAFLVLGCGVAVQLHWQRYIWGIGLTWIAAFYTSLLLLTIVNPGRIETLIFGSQLLRKLGTVAYAVYVFHQGINALFHLAVFGERPTITGWSSLGVTLLSLLTVLLLSAISWQMLEKPLVRYAHRTYQYTKPPA